MMSPRERGVAARTLVVRLSRLMQLGILRSLDHDVIYPAVDDVCRKQHEVFREFGPVRITLDGGLLRVNDSELADLNLPGSPQALQLLRDELRSRGLTALRLNRAVAPQELLQFLETWTAAGPGVDGADLQNRLFELGLTGVSLEIQGRGEGTAALESKKEVHFAPREVLDTYLGLVTVAEQLADAGGVVTPDLMTRVLSAIEHMAALTDSAPDLVLFAATYRDSDRYQSVHPTNTATLSMLLARRLGLGYEAITEVGRAGLLMDLGMPTNGPEVRRYQGELDEQMVHEVLEHPLRSFLRGLPLGLLESAHRAQLIVGWQHHVGVDGEGYPRSVSGEAPHLYARLVSVCDAYDALVHDRGDRAGLARPLALETLYQEAERRFDPELLFAFFEMLGRYPPGSVVRLDDGGIALVGAPPEDPRLFDRPELFLVMDRAGRPLPRPARIDLAHRRGERGGRIMHTLDDRLFEEGLFQLVFSEGLS